MRGMNDRLRARALWAHDIREACSHLKVAQNILRRAGSHKAADKVARALKSADGARRHTEGLACRVGNLKEGQT